MRIAMVTNDEFPPDVRIEKETVSLEESGNEVFVCTPLFNPSTDPAGRFRVIRIEDGLSVPSGLTGSLYRTLKALNVDFVQIQDTPQALAAVVASKRIGLPVVFDIHEIWPTLVAENTEHLSNRDILWSKRLQLDEMSGWFTAASILTVVEEASLYYSSRYKVRGDRVTAIRNFEDLERFHGIKPDTVLSEETRFKVTYVGKIEGTIRGLKEVLDAAKLLRNEDICFIIVGDGPYLASLQRYCADLHLEDVVRFLGRRSFREAMRIASASDACIMPHRSCISTEFTLPHKISQYMALEKLTISSNLGPIKRLFGGCYIPWDPRTPENLAEIILKARGDPASSMAYARRGNALVRDKNNWRGEGRRLAQLYESLSTR